MKERIDLYLIKKFSGLSRSQAQDICKRGEVFLNGDKVLKPNTKINPEIDFVDWHGLEIWGRGYHKIKSRLSDLSVNNPRIVADFGSSTGGFIQAWLEWGAEKIYGVDVGSGQLHPKAKDFPHVVNFEGVNLKEDFSLPEKVFYFSVDLSFISLKKVLPSLVKHLQPKAEGLILFKPQFELTKNDLNKQGLVKNQDLVKEALDNFVDLLNTLGFHLSYQRPCELKGKSGNQEYWFYVHAKDYK